MRPTVAVDEALRRKREQVCVGHLDAENDHRFDAAIGFFARPRYDIVATGERYDGASRVGDLMHENVTAFPDFHYHVERLHHADDAIVDDGPRHAALKGIALGAFDESLSRGLPLRHGGAGHVVACPAGRTE